MSVRRFLFIYLTTDDRSLDEKFDDINILVSITLFLAIQKVKINNASHLLFIDVNIINN